MELFAASYLVPISSPPVPGGAMVVDGDRIIETGTLAELRARYSVPPRDFPGCAIIPGLVNAHTHLELTHFPSWKIRKGIDYAPRTYVDWIIQVIKIRRALTPHELQLSIREGLRICLESGTTSIGEILSDRSFLSLYCDTPLSGRIFFEAIGHDPLRCEESLSALHTDLSVFRCGSFERGLSPHAPHTLSEQFHHSLRHLAMQMGIPRIIHLAESRAESDFYFDSSGMIADVLYPHVHWEEFIPSPRHTTATSWLDRHGLFDRSTTCVHGVHLTPADAEILKERGVAVVLCPRSNEKLAVGMAPAHLLKKLGIPLSLGTDSLASNDSLSLWDEMRFASDAYPEVFSPDEILAMATLDAARAIGTDQRLGSLDPGKRADFLVIKLPQFSSEQNLCEAIIHGGALAEVFAAGRPPSDYIITP
ncbi:amidohydrolase family protein [Geobacter pickeringii]|uniref:Metal-dependent hydrolase n=1 Tax=Geobacter pickeringii TaxID=345632 RepID=A0A0B5BDU7_9BACT|nr:amidohydrolase family protein [Geobacter pickeringii]AJE03324.1 metal-dependent hydrolase [Geobacter pickeringii]